jgi:hypothetical protein
MIRKHMSHRVVMCHPLGLMPTWLLPVIRAGVIIGCILEELGGCAVVVAVCACAVCVRTVDVPAAVTAFLVAVAAAIIGPDS